MCYTEAFHEKNFKINFEGRYAFTESEFTEFVFIIIISAGIYLFKVNNKNNRTICEICSKLIIKTSEHVIDAVLVPLLLSLNKFYTLFGVSIVDFEQVNADWDKPSLIIRILFGSIIYGYFCLKHLKHPASVTFGL